jgi:hypothetical protein
VSDQQTAGETEAPPEAAAPHEAAATTRIASYPSQAIRPIPSFVFTVPQGWVLDEAPDAITVIRTPEEVDGFWVNAILSHDRVPRSVDFKQAAHVTWQRLQQQCPDVEADLEQLARFGELVAYLRGASMTAPSTGKRIGQLQSLFFAPVHETGKTVDFFQLICTCTEEQVPRFAEPFMELISSFRFV